MLKKGFIIFSLIINMCIITSCKRKRKVSKKLEYKKLSDNTYQGVGTRVCENRKIVIPENDNDEKVTSIGEPAFLATIV